MAVLKFGGDGRHAWQTLYVNPTKNAKQLIDSSTHAGRPMPFVQAEWNNPNQHFTWALPSAQIIEGVVHYSDTAKPAARARVIVFSGQGISTGVDEDSNEVQTDANGKFRIYPKYGDHISVTVIPQNGAPYLMQTKRFLWKQTANRIKTLAFKLPRAVLMQGTVTEANSGKPVGNATVEYFAHKTKNPFFKSAFSSSSERLKQLAAIERLVDEKGTRIKKMTAGAYIVLSSGPAITRITTESKEVLSDMARMMSLDHKRYQKLQPDKNGYFTLPTLIPGAKFRLYGRRSDPQFEYRFRPVEMEFMVEPGKKKNLGDVILKIQK